MRVVPGVDQGADMKPETIEPRKDAGEASGGRYMAESGYVCQWLKEWLKGVL